jgi:hypothetical protein
MAALKGNWTRVTDGGMKAFPVVVAFYLLPEIV